MPVTMTILSMRTWRAALACLVLAIAAPWGLAASAPNPQAVPAIHSLVTDLTGTLTVTQRNRLEARLRAFSDRKGSQVAVLLVGTTAPESVEAYSLRVVDQWKLGRENVDDGVLLLVALDDRAARIEVGYGLEGALPDATAKRILSEVILPRLNSGDIDGGIEAGVDRILRTVDGEPLPAPPARTIEDEDLARALPFVILVVLAFGGMLRAALGRLPAASLAAACVAACAWLLTGAWLITLSGALAAFLVTLTGTGIGAGSPWIGGGRAGDGAPGGGGGRFGGGGASGRW